jgi:hypothetical protein
MITINKKEQELIDEVIDNFDFYKCQIIWVGDGSHMTGIESQQSTI